MIARGGVEPPVVCMLGSIVINKHVHSGHFPEVQGSTKQDVQASLFSALSGNKAMLQSLEYEFRSLLASCRRMRVRFVWEGSYEGGCAGFSVLQVVWQQGKAPEHLI